MSYRRFTLHRVCHWLLFSVALCLGAAQARANPLVIPVWPDGVPGMKNDIGQETTRAGIVSKVSVPTLTLYPTSDESRNGAAVIICPGGGYMVLSTDSEGEQYAKWLNTLGITAFVLKYRLKEYGHPAPLQDVLMAVRTLRSRAVEFGINRERIGVMGSSAGGHLAASAGTLFDSPSGRIGNSIDGVSARPDFLILLYPAISMELPYVHEGARKALMGAAPTKELIDLLSLDKQVTANTPPTLLVHTQEDQVVSVQNSILFYQALTKARVPAEMYLFEHGSHGMGMRKGLGTSSEWPKRAEEWLRGRGLISPAK